MATAQERKRLQRGLAAILADLADGKQRIPDDQLPSDMDELGGYLANLEANAMLANTATLTYQAVERATRVFAEAHSAAALVVVEEPTDEHLEAIKVQLHKISEAIKEEERFRIAFALAVRLGEIAASVDTTGT